MPNRRQDTRTRDRYDELAASWAAAVERLDARYWKVVVAVICIAIVVVLLVGFNVILLKRVDNNAASNTAALCALRMEIQARVVRNTNRLRRSEAFLRANPAGIPGISARVIREGVNEQRQEIMDQQRTVKALGGIDCD